MEEAILADQDFTENLTADINVAAGNSSRNSIINDFLEVTGSKVGILHSDWNQ
ncbi:histone-lysine N-methyltransferase ATX4 isoform X1 [Sesbania bispinosa]|nr:histone-lysine N-methyltransferase ATX4 isoform X1 [Sesbania bispinosa]